MSVAAKAHITLHNHFDIAIAIDDLDWQAEVAFRIIVEGLSKVGDIIVPDGGAEVTLGGMA
ncbi:hypothetical protein [Sphingomonas sp. SRS2]|uniref:hypothetical protein n=1 Tax=Sphingomonas sp. SRS2 TaxID=133190 RepID=UPI0006184F23|nr:hypothetical protein [Sphingomonas sp. SRS2]KKC27142.1 hypothetical protein WP12_04970 [Sphingomonas sp. SRS2]